MTSTNPAKGEAISWTTTATAPREMRHRLMVQDVVELGDTSRTHYRDATPADLEAAGWTPRAMVEIMRQSCEETVRQRDAAQSRAEELQRLWDGAKHASYERDEARREVEQWKATAEAEQIGHIDARREVERLKGSLDAAELLYDAAEVARDAYHLTVTDPAAIERRRLSARQLLDMALCYAGRPFSATRADELYQSVTKRVLAATDARRTNAATGERCEACDGEGEFASDVSGIIDKCPDCQGTGQRKPATEQTWTPQVGSPVRCKETGAVMTVTKLDYSGGPDTFVWCGERSFRASALEPATEQTGEEPSKLSPLPWRVGTWKAHSPDRQIFDDEGGRVADCLEKEDAAFIVSRCNASPPSPGPGRVVGVDVLGRVLAAFPKCCRCPKLARKWELHRMNFYCEEHAKEPPCHGGFWVPWISALQATEQALEQSRERETETETQTKASRPMTEPITPPARSVADFIERCRAVCTCPRTGPSAPTVGMVPKPAIIVGHRPRCPAISIIAEVPPKYSALFIAEFDDGDGFEPDTAFCGNNEEWVRDYAGRVAETPFRVVKYVPASELDRLTAENAELRGLVGECEQYVFAYIVQANTNEGIPGAEKLLTKLRASGTGNDKEGSGP